MEITRKIGEITLPAIGQGIGDYSWNPACAKIIRQGIELGMNLIDTAESYDDGNSENIIGKAIEGIRDKVIISTKFSPEHHRFGDVLKAAENSLRRLNTDYIDIYQIHWPNEAVPILETLSAMEKLVKEGKVRYLGFGNFYLNEIKAAQSLLKNENITAIEMEYNLFDRMAEDEILPYCAENNILLLAYSPIDQGRIADGNERGKTLSKIAEKYSKTPAQIALRWLSNKPNVIPIPKATSLKHLHQNADVAKFNLDQVDMLEIDEVFKRDTIYIMPDRIQVSLQGQGNRSAYQTLEEALANKMNNVPSPSDLAKSIVKNKNVKRVRLIRSFDPNGQFDYELVEGRIRYWAWVIAFGNKPIPAYIREEWP